jgi:hypothetical protein
VNRNPFAHNYTGARVMPFAPPTPFVPAMHFGPGTCKFCGHPSGQCRCGCRECRKEAKELVVESRGTGRAVGTVAGQSFRLLAEANSTAAGGTAPAAGTPGAAPAPAAGTAKAFIGGGCCVHISIEYAPATPTAAALVGVIVTDTEGTTLAWEKIEQPGAHYQVKENVVTTKPGATVTVLAVNATARIRWCEVFSC